MLPLNTLCMEMVVYKPMREDKYLVFKDKRGKVVSVATKNNSSDESSELRIWIEVTGSVSAEYISKEEYQKLKPKI